MSEETVKDPGRVDAVFVQQAQRGDGDAFAALFNQLHQPVLNYIYHMLGDRQAAEDVTQDAFIRAHERIDQLGPPWDFKSWVFRIASNLAVDYLREQRRFVDTDEPEMMMGPPSTRRPSERGVQQDEARRAVWMTMDALPTIYRQALILREFNGLSYQEVSQALECTYDNARQLVHRARLRFRERHGLRMTLEAGVERCRELGDLISAYHDGELDTIQRKAVQAHIAACPQCRETEEDLRKVGALIAGLVPIWPSEGWIAHVLEQMGLPEAPAQPVGESGDGSGVGGGNGAGMGGGADTGGLGSYLASGSWAVKAGAALMASFLVVGGFLLASLILKPPAPPPSPSMAPTQPATEPLPPASEEESTPEPGAGGDEQPPTATARRTNTVTITVTASATEGQAEAEAIMNSNCRFGPGSIYDIVDTLLEGQSARIDGRNADATWWWVERMTGSGHCWVWDELVIVSGNTQAVPIILAPPSPTPEDTTKPSVSVTYMPMGRSSPDEDDVITFSATASDDRGIDRIEIWVRAPNVKVFSLLATCQASTTCTAQAGPYPPGTMSFYARAYDVAGNMGESTPQQAQIHAVLN